MAPPAPSRAKARAIAQPIPRPPPATKATLPFKRSMAPSWRGTVAYVRSVAPVDSLPSEVPALPDARRARLRSRGKNLPRAEIADQDECGDPPLQASGAFRPRARFRVFAALRAEMALLRIALASTTSPWPARPRPGATRGSCAVLFDRTRCTASAFAAATPASTDARVSDGVRGPDSFLYQEHGDISRGACEDHCVRPLESPLLAASAFLDWGTVRHSFPSPHPIAAVGAQLSPRPPADRRRAQARLIAGRPSSCESSCRPACQTWGLGGMEPS